MTDRVDPPRHQAFADDAVAGRELEMPIAGGTPGEAGREAAAAIEHLGRGPAGRAEPGGAELPTARAGDGLRRNRDFRVVIGGQSISALGDAITFTALPLLVVALTGSGVAMGTVGALQSLPDLVLGLPAGALADRWDRRRMIVLADLGRALLTALIPLSVLLGWDTMTVVLLVTAPINALRVIFMAAFTAVVPNLVRPDQVGYASGVTEAVLSLSFIVGPVLAGLLVGVIGAGSTLAIDAASFLVSAATVMLVRRPLQAERRAPRGHIMADVVEGLRYIRGERTLRLVIAFWSSYSIITAPLVPAVIFFLTIDRAAAPQVVGLVLSGYGVGYTVGALLAGRYATGRLGLYLLASCGLQGPILVLFALVGWSPVQAAMTFAAGLVGAVSLVSYLTLRATIPPDELLGRVGSTARTISLGLSPIGVFVGGVALEVVGGQATMLLIASLLAAAVAIFALSGTLRRAVSGTGRRAPATT